MKKIIFFDVDGTLIDVPRGLPEPSDLTKYAINELKNNGDLVFIASGRFKGNLPRSIIALNPSGFILSNGAYIEYQGKTIYKNEFDHKLFDELSDYCQKHNCIFTGETQDYIYTPVKDKRFSDFLKKWKIEFVKTTDKKEGTFYKCVANFFDYDSAVQFEKDFKGKVDYRAQTADPECLAYDININGVNKGNAVYETIKILGIEKNNTYCFCDGTNDLELAKACKNSYAMSNGDERLKKVAYGIADDVIKDGVYHKLVELGLINKMH